MELQDIPGDILGDRGRILREIRIFEALLMTIENKVSAKRKFQKLLV
jgi:hypothetical protein